MLAKRGYRVVVIEKEPHPRFHIGESLLPQTMDLLRTLGIYEKVEQAGFVPKWGASFMLADGEKANTFYFQDGLLPGRSGAFQVLRSRFDHLLLNHSRQQGAEVREGHTLRELAVGEDEVRAVVRDADDAGYTLRARFFADATGRDAFLVQNVRLVAGAVLRAGDWSGARRFQSDDVGAAAFERVCDHRLFLQDGGVAYGSLYCSRRCRLLPRSDLLLGRTSRDFVWSVRRGSHRRVPEPPIRIRSRALGPLRAADAPKPEPLLQVHSRMVHAGLP